MVLPIQSLNSFKSELDEKKIPPELQFDLYSIRVTLN